MTAVLPGPILDGLGSPSYSSSSDLSRTGYNNVRNPIPKSNDFSYEAAVAEFVRIRKRAAGRNAWEVGVISMFRPTTILHPTDFSDYSRQAFQIAVDLARNYGAKLLILHVVETLGPENVTFGEVAGQLEPEAY